MVRYFYEWTALVILGAVVLLSLPWLALIALMFAVPASLAALAAIAWAVVAALLAGGRAIGHRWHTRSVAARPRPGASAG